jgi:hypothetical protein
MYIKYFQLLFTAHYTHQNCVRVVPPEDGQVMPEKVEALSFNKVKVIVNCIKLVLVIKLISKLYSPFLKYDVLTTRTPSKAYSSLLLFRSSKSSPASRKGRVLTQVCRKLYKSFPTSVSMDLNQIF